MPQDIYGNEIIEDTPDFATIRQVDTGAITRVAKTPETAHMFPSQDPGLPPELTPEGVAPVNPETAIRVSNEPPADPNDTSFMDQIQSVPAVQAARAVADTATSIPTNAVSGIVQGAKQIYQSTLQPGGVTPEQLQENQRIAEERLGKPISQVDTSATPVAPSSDVASFDNIPPRPQIEEPQPAPAFQQPAPAGSSVESRINNMYNQIDRNQRNAAKEYADAEERINKANAPLRENTKSAQETYDQKVGDYEKAVEDLQNSSIDPNRFWANTSTGDKILAGISIFLGGVAGAQTKTQNSAMAIIDNAINRDLEAQKANLSKKEGLAKTQGSMLSLFNDRLKDSQASLMASEKHAWDLVHDKVNNVINNTQNDKTKAELLGFLTSIEAKRQAAGAQMNDELVTQAALASDPTTVDHTKLPMKTLERFVSTPPTIHKYTDNKGQVIATPIAGAAGFAGNLEDAKTARALIAGRQSFDSAISDLKAFRKSVTTGAFLGTDRDAVARAIELKMALTKSLREIEHTGVPQKYELEMIEQQFGGNPASVGIDTLMKNTTLTEALGQRVHNESNDKLNSLLLPNKRINVAPNEWGRPQQQRQGNVRFQPVK